MCQVSEAAQERLSAATELRRACEEQYGLRTSLKTIFKPQPTPADMLMALRKLDEKRT